MLNVNTLLNLVVSVLVLLGSTNYSLSKNRSVKTWIYIYTDLGTEETPNMEVGINCLYIKVESSNSTGYTTQTRQYEGRHGMAQIITTDEHGEKVAGFISIETLNGKILEEVKLPFLNNGKTFQRISIGNNLKLKNPSSLCDKNPMIQDYIKEISSPKSKSQGKKTSKNKRAILEGDNYELENDPRFLEVKDAFDTHIANLEQLIDTLEQEVRQMQKR